MKVIKREDSCKFRAGKPYNDQRYTLVLDEPNDKETTDFLNKLELGAFLLDFYKYREKIWHLSNYTLLEVGVAIDTPNNTVKLYYNISGHIYAAGVKGKKTGFKHYRNLENYPKPQIREFLGEKQSIFEILSDYKPEYKEFYHNSTFKFWEERYSDNIKSIFDAEPNCYHGLVYDLNIKIGENQDLIEKLLKSQNCNIDNIDNWVEKNKERAITWLSLLKDGVTLYYNT